MKTLVRLLVVLAVFSYPFAAQDVASVYGSKCAHCHGQDGRGNTPLGRALKIGDLRSAQVQDRSEEDLGAVIGRGAAQGKMPGFEKKLGADMVRQLATYVHNLSSQAQPPTVKPSDVKEVYSSRCAHCHGNDGRGETVLGREMKIPALQFRMAQLSDQQLGDVIAHGAGRGKMPDFKKKLGEEMVGELAKYVRALSGPASAGAPIAASMQAQALKQESSQVDSVPAGEATPALAKSSGQKPLAPHDPHGAESVSIAESHASVERSTQTGLTPPSGESQIIDLNSASKDVLMTLPG